MKVMVLGGRGFVGTSVVKQLLARGDTKVMIGSRKASEHAGLGQVKQVAVDSRDEAGMVNALKSVDAVINCVTGDGASIANGAEILVKAAARSGKPRIVHLSTMSVYGSQHGMVTEQTAFRDDLGWYGQAKIEAEHHMARYAAEGGQVVTLRPGVIIGPGSKPWVGRIARWLMSGHLADLGPQGDGPANLVDVEDVAQAAVLALHYSIAADNMAAFNLAAPDSPRWNEYFGDVALALGAIPLQRWGPRRLKLEVYARGVPLKALERIAGKLGLDTNRLPEGIPPSLMNLWTQQITLCAHAAAKDLHVKWTPYRTPCNVRWVGSTMKQVHQLANIQCLRAVAALMVVWVHAKEQAGWLDSMFPSNIGAHGVDLFFVVSGFIMVVATWNKNMSPKEFWAKRIARIVPFYWLCTAGVLTIALLAPNLTRSTDIVWSHVWASFLFIPAESPALPGHWMPLVVPGWTLNYEMAFYALFGSALLLQQKIRPLIIVAVLAGITAAGWLFKPTGSLKFLSDAIILIFGAGVILGNIYCKGMLKHKPLTGWLLIALGSLFLIIPKNIDFGHRVIGAGIPALIIVTGFCFLSGNGRSWPNWLVKLGDASYSIYLSHIFVLPALRNIGGRVLQQERSLLEGLIIMACGMLACAAAGLFVHKFVEMPLLKFASTYVDRVFMKPITAAH